MQINNWNQRKIIGLASIGGALEFFDFTIYALFAHYLSQNFFPTENRLNGLLSTFAVFALGYCARPIGGIIFGHIGDKYGRKVGFTASALIMATATLLMGCCPSYQSIGILAPIMLVILRILQGISVGGEIPGATIFTYEHVGATLARFAIGLIFMAITLGNVLGSAFGAVLTHLLNPVQMQSWGWRIPFAAGFFLGILCYYVRKQLAETPKFTELLRQNAAVTQPIPAVLKNAWPQMLMGLGLTAFPAAIIFLFLYLPSYLNLAKLFTSAQLYTINTISFTTLAVGTALAGYASQFISRQKLMQTGLLLTLLLSYFLFAHLQTLNILSYGGLCIGLAIFGAMVNGCYVSVLVELFQTEIRYSGMAIAYNIGFAGFGGFAPLAMLWLQQRTSTLIAPYYLLCCAIAITWLALSLIKFSFTPSLLRRYAPRNDGGF